MDSAPSPAPASDPDRLFNRMEKLETHFVFDDCPHCEAKVAGRELVPHLSKLYLKSILNPTIWWDGNVIGFYRTLPSAERPQRGQAV